MAGKVKERGVAATPTKIFSLIDDATLKDLYATMLKCRAIQNQAASGYKSGKPGKEEKWTRLPEATVVGTTIDLRAGDWVVPCEGDLTAAFVKGVSLDSVLGSEIGDETAGALVHSTHNVLRPSLSTASRMNIAVGIGLANRDTKDGAVVMLFSPAKEAAGKHWRAAASFASKSALPLLFVVYEEDVANSKSGKKRKRESPRTEDYGFPVIPVDANDVVAMYRVAHESIHKARQGRGPTLIEAKVFRVGEDRGNKGPGDGKSDDGIVKMEEYLTGKGLYTAAWKRKLAEQFRKVLDAAIAAAQ